MDAEPRGLARGWHRRCRRIPGLLTVLVILSTEEAQGFGWHGPSSGYSPGADGPVTRASSHHHTSGKGRGRQDRQIAPKLCQALSQLWGLWGQELMGMVT